MLPNSTKTNQYLSLGSNGVDRVRSLQKIPMRLNGTNLSINCTSSTRSAPISCSNETLTNAPKHYENAPKHKFRVQWGWIACVHCQKFRCEFVARTFALIAPVQSILHRVSCSNETIQNAPKHYETHQFMSFASNGMDPVRSLRKTLMQFRGTNFFINCTSSNHFASSSG